MRKTVLTVSIAAITSMITVFALSLYYGKYNEKQTYFNNQLPVHQASFSGNGMPAIGPDFTTAAEKTVHAVVHIKTQYTYKNSYYDQYFGYDPFFNFFQRPYGNQTYVAAGSGVLVSENGYIVTNNHVVSDASLIEVTLNDKRTYTAKLIGADLGTDLALIKIEESSLPYITYGNSDAVKVGEWVLAVGNPFNLTSTVTAGIVSAKARNINILRDQSKYPIESYIQTDAAVNRGNSGGALVNLRGELVGINSAIISPSGAYSGYSFAIPINIVKKVVADIIKYGEVQRAVLGINFSDIDSKLAKEKGIKEMRGVYVVSVFDNSASFKAGLQRADIITKIDDSPINSQSELKENLIRHRPRR